MTQDNHRAHVAQLVEHVLGKDEVTRSIRVVGSIPCLTRAEHAELARPRVLMIKHERIKPLVHLEKE
jgi:hypothetical protein